VFDSGDFVQRLARVEGIFERTSTDRLDETGAFLGICFRPRERVQLRLWRDLLAPARRRPASADARGIHAVTPAAAPDRASSIRRDARCVGRAGVRGGGGRVLRRPAIWTRFQMVTTNGSDEPMGDPTLPTDFAITPSRPSLAAQDRGDGFDLVGAAAPQSVLCVRAAGEKQRIITIAAMNPAFDVFHVRIG
jgi:hypothetical protein